MSAEEIVASFIHAVERKDFERALALVTDDVEYDNVPMSKVYGPDGIRSVLEPFMTGAEEVEWVIHRQLSDGRTVMNERTDRFRVGGRWLELPVVGIWEIRDGKIALWRDYFDMPTLTGQMTG
jgi:limonene-1,2-epoxide hydrolase